MQIRKETPMTDIAAVTGAEGFIGSHLVEGLVRRGYRVKAMVLYNMWSSTAWLETLDPEIIDQVDVVFGDVRDPATVLQLVEGASVVYHLAAIGSVPYSYSAPRSFIDTNTIGTMHVLEAVRSCRTPRMVHTSTSETYGTARTVPISESHPLQSQSPYAASKTAADKLAESYHLSFGLPVVTLRTFNTFGPRQSTRAVIGELFNCDPGDDIAIGKLAEDIARLMGVEADIVEDPKRLRPKDSEVMRLVCDATKLRERTGWRPQYTRDEGLAETIEWFRDPANLARFKTGEYHQ